MADNRLNLIVSFLGIDKLSGPLKNIMGLGQTGKQELRALSGEAKDLNRQMREVEKAIGGTSGNVTRLVEQEKQLSAAIASVNGRIERRKRLMAIDARTARMQAAGKRMVGEGMSTLFWGSMMLAPAYESARLGGEVEAMTNRLRVLGLGDAAVRDLRAYADAMNVAGSSTVENMRYIVEAQGVFRETGAHSLTEQLAGAKLMAPIMARLNVATHSLGMTMGEDQERSFLRFIEQAGGTNDSRRAAQLADGLFRALQSSGGNVQASDYQSFLARAGSAGMRLSARSLFADFEPLIAELHDTAGVGLQSAWLRANGMVKNKAAMNEFARLGMFDMSKVKLDALGGVQKLIGGQNPMNAKAASLLSTDPVEFYRKILLPAYQKMGVEDRTRENVLLFGRTGGQLFNLIDKQLPTILRSRGAFDRSQSLDKAYEGTRSSFFGAQGQMTAAWKDFLVVAGQKGGLLEMMTGALRTATGALRDLTAFGNANPTAFRWILTAVTWLIGMRLASAAVKIAFGGLLGPVASLWGLWSKFRAGAGLIELLPVAANVAGVLRIAVLALGRAFLQAGVMMLANPLFWIPAAIVAATALIIYFREDIGAAFVWLYDQFRKLPDWAQWAGRGMLSGFLTAFPPTALAVAIINASKSAKKAFMDFWGIKSPSRVMMQMGGHMANGLAIGIDRGAQGPHRAITRLAAGMGVAMAVASPATAHQRGAMNGSISVTINVYQQPGEDGEAFAERVAQIVERNGRRKRLGAYEDDF